MYVNVDEAATMWVRRMPWPRLGARTTAASRTPAVSRRCDARTTLDARPVWCALAVDASRCRGIEASSCRAVELSTQAGPGSAASACHAALRGEVEVSDRPPKNVLAIVGANARMR